MPIERIPLSEAHNRMKAQGVPSNHIAFACPICNTVQSMASLVKAGVAEEKVEQFIAFSCEGRWTSAGPWPSDNDKSAKAKTRRKVRGCDWTLGGLFQVHSLEIVFPGDEPEKDRARPTFRICTPEEAQALHRLMADAETTE